MRTFLMSLAALLAGGATPSGPPAHQTGYHVVRRYPLGGDGGWDYLTFDTTSRRLFVARSTRVMVIDADAGTVVGEIANTPGVHGVALAPELRRGFASAGRDQSVSVFETGSLKPLARVQTTGGNPDAILYEPATRRVFTFNGAGRNATAIDAASPGVVGTVPLDGKPEFAVAPGDGRIFVNIEDKAELAALDARTLAVTARWPLAPCEEPTGLALDARHERLFVGCSNQLMTVVDSRAGRVVATLPIGRGVDGVVFDPGTSLAFSSNGEGTLTVVREVTPDSFAVVENAVTQRGARTLALDPRTHDVFVVTADGGGFVLLVVGR